MKWEIIMLTMGSRVKYREQALSLLLPQGRDSNGEVALTIAECDGSPVGEQKQRLKEASKGDYISFFDDDDFPSLSYVSTILPKLDGVDYVGFNVRLIATGHLCEEGMERTAVHSLRYEQWSESEDKNTLYRGISHCNPMRRELSLVVPMGGGWGEDFRWQKELTEKGIVKTEHYLDWIAFYYMERYPKLDEVDWQDVKRLKVLKTLQEGKEYALGLL